jgi:hypothetical protein
MANRIEKLTSIRLQQVINIKIPQQELCVPVLRFGRKGTEMRFPVTFSSEDKSIEVYSKLHEFIGKPINVVLTQCDILSEQYKQYDYKIILKDKLTNN